MTAVREIRRGRADDIPALIDILWRGVHEGAAPRYSAQQCRAWMPVRPTPEGFAIRLAGQAVFVAELDGVPTGFMTLRGDGCVDFAYVVPEARGTGTADALLAMLVNHARISGIGTLTARASDMARPFFARHGWTTIAPAPQVRDDVTIPATDMTLPLAA